MLDLDDVEKIDLKVSWIWVVYWLIDITYECSTVRWWVLMDRSELNLCRLQLAHWHN